MTSQPRRSFGDVRLITYTGSTGRSAQITFPKEISEILKRAGVKAVRVTTTREGILVVPYREPELPEWAKEETT